MALDPVVQIGYASEPAEVISLYIDDSKRRYDFLSPSLKMTSSIIFQMTFIEISSMRAFSPGDSIESIAFDAKNFRLVATSHYGRITMFKYSLGKLTELWAKENNDYIPRAVRFVDNGENVLVYGLENGIV
jgi:hypothetical protein